MDDYLHKFKNIAEFLEWCKASVYNPGYLQSVSGRTRWFFNVANESSMAAQQREACNYLVQNLVAEAISWAGLNLTKAHEWSKVPFRSKLTCHDSALIACRGQDAEYICEEVMARCLNKDNVIPGLNFSFGIEMGLHTRYACKASKEELAEIGVPDGYWPADCEASVGPEGQWNNPYPTAAGPQWRPR